jgi:ATP phosphoribosyltransferase
MADNLRQPQLFPDIDDDEISCSLVRAQEMSVMWKEGLDLGSRRDWIIENESDVVRRGKPGLFKGHRPSARWVHVVRDDSPVKTPIPRGETYFDGTCELHEEILQERSIRVHVEFSWGATEAKVRRVSCTPSWK